MRVSASAPASLMLMGEYAVLHGHRALVCAVDKRMRVVMSWRDDKTIRIESTALGVHVTSLTELTVVKPFQFVLTILKRYQPQLKQGLDIFITADFSTTIGFGSSAAVTIATLKALNKLLNRSLSLLELTKEGRSIVQAVQGRGSGADIAAAVYGGIVSYRMHQSPSLRAQRSNPSKISTFTTIDDGAATLAATMDPEIECINHIFPLTAIYVGFKTPTAEAIKLLQDRFANNNALLQSILNTIGECAEAGFNYATEANWPELGRVMTIQQGLMQALGVSLPVIDELIQHLLSQPSILGAKISGSGLGDCVIGLGELEANQEFKSHYDGVCRIPVAMSQLGVQCEEI